MTNTLMTEKELNVKAGDRVRVHGYVGTCVEVHKYTARSGEDCTSIQVKFDEMQTYGTNKIYKCDLVGTAYDMGEYGQYTVL